MTKRSKSTDCQRNPRTSLIRNPGAAGQENHRFVRLKELFEQGDEFVLSQNPRRFEPFADSFEFDQAHRVSLEGNEFPAFSNKRYMSPRRWLLVFGPTGNLRSQS